MAPTFRHGRGTVVLANQYNLGGILNDASKDASVETAETTVFGLSDKTYLAGQIDHKIAYKGLYDGAYSTALLPRSRVQEVLQASLGSTSYVVNTIGLEGDTIGRRAALFNGIPDSLKFSSPVSDAVKVEASLAMVSKLSNGEWLNDITTAVPNSTAGSTYAVVDGLKLTTGGGAVHAHVPSYTSTGSWVFKTRHSSNGSAFTDLTTARTLNSTRSYVRVEVTGTIKRYVKAIVTSVSTGSAPKLGIAYGRNYI
jgi:hypothetical protein